MGDIFKQILLSEQSTPCARRWIKVGNLVIHHDLLQDQQLVAFNLSKPHQDIRPHQAQLARW